MNALAVRLSIFIGLSLAGFGCSTSPVSLFPSGRQPHQVTGVKHAGEGPVWDRRSGSVYYVGDDCISRLTKDKKERVFRAPVKGANGLLLDHEGRLIACEAGNRRVTRTEKDGSITVLAEFYEGKRFNSPNDLSIDLQGRVYFTDPRYGQRGTMELFDVGGNLVEGVYRIDAPGKVVRILDRTSVDRPNGVLVSPDEQYIYVADNNNSVGGTRKLWRFNLDKDGFANPKSRRLIFDWKTSRGPDGLKMDTRNRIYVAAGLNRDNLPDETAKPYTGGIYVLSEKGRLLDFISIPKDEVTNCAFGDEDLKTLYITAGGILWWIRVSEPGRVTY